jgi:hypothetical protein
MIAILVFIIFIMSWYYNTPNDITKEENTHLSDTKSLESSIIPTMHARCHADHPCGGDLTCDMKCFRCRKKDGGECATDTDCESGLICHNWKCSPNLTAAIKSQNLKTENLDYAHFQHPDNIANRSITNQPISMDLSRPTLTNSHLSSNDKIGDPSQKSKSQTQDEESFIIPSLKSSLSKNKSVRWNTENNKIYYIPPRNIRK